MTELDLSSFNQPAEVEVNTTILNNCQNLAFTKFQDFMKQDKKVAMLLSGGAGVGKSFLTATILSYVRNLGIKPNKVIVCAPTHKAVGVLKRFMRSTDLAYIPAPQSMRDLKREMDYNPYNYIVATTSKALSIRPIMDDEEDIEGMHDVKNNMKFDKGGYEFLEAVKPKVIIVDEVSMLPRKQFLEIVKWCKACGCMMLMVGDKGQLPPVGTQGIPFDRIVIKHELKQNMRALGSAGANIVELGKAIRFGNKGAYKTVTGEGIKHVSDIRTEFLKNVIRPGLDEEQWTVFIGYKNKTVDKMREYACQHVYGHSAHEFKAGEIVVSDQRFDISFNNCIDNQGVLKVVSTGETCPTKGLEVEFECVETHRTFVAWVLGKKQLANNKHPFNRELVRRQQHAKKLESDKKTTPVHEWTMMDEDDRREGWREFFIWRDSTVIEVNHPFALTSHKSQGSTFNEVYVAAPELERFNTRALYVAASRARTKVVLQTPPRG